MKISKFLILVLSMTSVKAQAFHCENEINTALSIWNAQIETSAFAHQPPSQMIKTEAVNSASYHLHPTSRKASFDGINSVNGIVTITSETTFLNPDETEKNKKPNTGLLPESKIVLDKNCRLQSFSLTHYSPAGKTLKSSAVTIGAEECKKIYSQSAAKDDAIWKKLNPNAEKEVYAKAILNCRHGHRHSGNLKRDVPAFARLAASDAELEALYFDKDVRRNESESTKTSGAGSR